MLQQQNRELLSAVPALLPVTPYAPDAGMRRRLGAFYTPGSAADFMAEWVVRHDSEHILEPSFGDGSFLRAVTNSATRRNFASILLSGIEIDAKAQASALHAGLIAGDSAHHADFLAVSPFPVHAVIGNPPYVRLRHLPNDERERALAASRAAMGRAMDPAGSLWMSFVLHAMRFLELGGRFAFVLPYDFTYVRYARPLWEHLQKHFGSLHVMRAHERLFPELLQDVVILLADDFGNHTDNVRFQAFERVSDLLSGRPSIDEHLRIDDIVRGQRVFLEALLGKELRSALNTRIAELTVPAREFVTFNIGYVAGDKKFFHPTFDDICRFDLPPKSLYPTLTTARMMKGGGLTTSAFTSSQIDLLFLPPENQLSDGEREYIAMGERQGVSRRYKCQIRNPWFRVPGTRVPDVVLSVFSELPLLLINDARCFASNSLLCGYSRGVSPEQIAASWYTSLTRLYCELEVHALGGGVMVLVPQETGNIRLPRRAHPSPEHLAHINLLLKRGNAAGAYQRGDREILIEQVGLRLADIDLIAEGIGVLAHWRTSARSSA